MAHESCCGPREDKPSTPPIDPGQHPDDHKDGLNDLHGHANKDADVPIWKTAKARLTLTCAAAFGLAFLLAKALPQTAPWGFIAAMMIGLLPISWRALKGIRKGYPFTIETLMTVAAVGAILIKAAEEAAVVIVLFLVGELLEGFAAGRARASIKALATLVPIEALLEQDGKALTVQANILRYRSHQSMRIQDGGAGRFQQGGNFHWRPALDQDTEHRHTGGAEQQVCGVGFCLILAGHARQQAGEEQTAALIAGVDRLGEFGIETSSAVQLGEPRMAAPEFAHQVDAGKKRRPGIGQLHQLTQPHEAALFGIGIKHGFQ